ncbi:methyltransferase family protein [Thermodesulfobacteriota bacterium]
MAKELHHKASKSALWVVYIVIIFEMLYMSTPFALFFYSVYGIPLKLLARYDATLWLVQNILPHFTQTKSLLINTFLHMSWPLMGIGFLIFIIGFCQVYWAKFRRRGPVVGGLYRFIRHPQYAGWVIFGFGMSIFWSRMIVWIMYVSMLFVYYLLAASEEKECLEKYGESYSSYLLRTGRFFPRIVRKNKAYSRPLLPQTRRARISIITFLYLLVIGGTIAMGLLVRSYTLSKISAKYEKDAAVVSLASMDHGHMSSILSVALNDPLVKARLDRAHDGLHAKRLIYIVPSEWHITELAMEAETRQERRHGINPTNHGNPANFDRNRFKVLISKALVAANAEGNEILSGARGQKPLLLVKVDLKKNAVTAIETPPKQGKYGDLPVPVF